MPTVRYGRLVVLSRIIIRRRLVNSSSPTVLYAVFLFIKYISLAIFSWGKWKKVIQPISRNSVERLWQEHVDSKLNSFLQKSHIFLGRNFSGHIFWLVLYRNSYLVKSGFKTTKILFLAQLRRSLRLRTVIDTLTP
jgi:hypothetical protein